MPTRRVSHPLGGKLFQLKYHSANEYIVISKQKNDIINPKREISLNGKILKETNPLNENENNDNKLNFVFPATLIGTLKGIYV